MGPLLIRFFIAFSIFLIVDFLWLGYIAKSFYQTQLGPLLKTPNWTIAFIFYALFVIGILIFAIQPALETDDVKKALILGALFGFFTYMTYDLTNLATLKNWPPIVAVVDIIWGTCLCATVAGLSTWLIIKIT